MFIDSLPKNEIYSIPKLKKVYQELERKFGVVKVKQLDESKITVRGVSAPLSSNAYDRWIMMIGRVVF